MIAYLSYTNHKEIMLLKKSVAKKFHFLTMDFLTMDLTIFFSVLKKCAKFDDFRQNNYVFTKPDCKTIAYFKKSFFFFFLRRILVNSLFLPVFEKITAYLNDQCKQKMPIAKKIAQFKISTAKKKIYI